MESRLSTESLSAIYNSGCSGLAFDRSAFESQIFWDRVNFQELLASSDPALAISELSAQRLYYSLIEKGPADCLDVIAHISQDQFLRILDYDVWRKDEFVPARVLYWVDLLRQISPEKAYENFRDLEEEYQLSTLSPYIKIYDQEAYENMTDIDQDRLQRLPGDAMFYSIETQDPEIHERIVGLLESITAYDINYLLSLIAHAAYLPQNEAALTASQFRKARLEEDGFVSYEESLTCFQELDPLAYKAKFSNKNSTKQEVLDLKDESFFFDKVLSYGQTQWNEQQRMQVQQALVSLANSLCTVTQIEADDLNALKFLFTNGKALSSLGLEFLSEGDLQNASEILLNTACKDLFRIGLSLIRTHQKEWVRMICEDTNITEKETFKKYFYQQRYALLLNWIDKHIVDAASFEFCEILKGMFNRFPQIPREIQEMDTKRISFFPISKLSELKEFELIMKRFALCFQTQTPS